LVDARCENAGLRPTDFSKQIQGYRHLSDAQGRILDQGLAAAETLWSETEAAQKAEHDWQQARLAARAGARGPGPGDRVDSGA
jgi:hypothetical protein